MYHLYHHRAVFWLKSLQPLIIRTSLSRILSIWAFSRTSYFKTFPNSPGESGTLSIKFCRHSSHSWRIEPALLTFCGQYNFLQMILVNETDGTGVEWLEQRRSSPTAAHLSTLKLGKDEAKPLASRESSTVTENLGWNVKYFTYRPVAKRMLQVVLRRVLMSGSPGFFQLLLKYVYAGNKCCNLLRTCYNECFQLHSGMFSTTQQFSCRVRERMHENCLARNYHCAITQPLVYQHFVGR